MDSGIIERLLCNAIAGQFQRGWKMRAPSDVAGMEGRASGFATDALAGTSRGRQHGQRHGQRLPAQRVAAQRQDRCACLVQVLTGQRARAFHMLAR